MNSHATFLAFLHQTKAQKLEKNKKRHRKIKMTMTMECPINSKKFYLRISRWRIFPTDLVNCVHREGHHTDRRPTDTSFSPVVNWSILWRFSFAHLVVHLFHGMEKISNLVNEKCTLGVFFFSIFGALHTRMWKNTHQLQLYTYIVHIKVYGFVCSLSGRVHR